MQNLKLANDLMLLVANGQKRLTIRNGRRSIELGPLTFEPAIDGPDAPPSIEVAVHQVCHKKLGHLTKSETMLDDVESPVALLALMRQFYPDIDMEDEVTLIYFGLPWFTPVFSYVPTVTLTEDFESYSWENDFDSVNYLLQVDGKTLFEMSDEVVTDVAREALATLVVSLGAKFGCEKPKNTYSVYDNLKDAEDFRQARYLYAEFASGEHPLIPVLQEWYLSNCGARVPIDFLTRIVKRSVGLRNAILWDRFDLQYFDKDTLFNYFLGDVIHHLDRPDNSYTVEYIKEFFAALRTALAERQWLDEEKFDALFSTYENGVEVLEVEPEPEPLPPAPFSQFASVDELLEKSFPTVFGDKTEEELMEEQDNE